MSELEPDDSRTVTNTQNRAPGEPPRTGPREGEAHAAAGQQAEASQTRANQGFATEGDSPAHPDRFGGVATSEKAARQVEQAEERDGDGEDYVPEGK